MTGLKAELEYPNQVRNLNKLAETQSWQFHNFHNLYKHFAKGRRYFELNPHFTQPADDVGDEEGTPAEEEHPHDDPHRDGSLVLLHQAVADVMASGGPGDLDHLGCPPLYLLLDQAGLLCLLLALHSTQQLIEGSSKLIIHYGLAPY